MYFCNEQKMQFAYIQEKKLPIYCVAVGSIISEIRKNRPCRREKKQEACNRG